MSVEVFRLGKWSGEAGAQLGILLVTAAFASTPRFPLGANEACEASAHVPNLWLDWTLTNACPAWHVGSEQIMSVTVVATCPDGAVGTRTLFGGSALSKAAAEVIERTICDGTKIIGREIGSDHCVALNEDNLALSRGNYIY